MRTIFRVLALSALTAAPLAAQNAQTREGFAISFGLGGGSGAMTADGGSSDRRGAPSGYLRVGGAYKPNLILSGEINAWTKSQDGATLTIGTVNATAQYYPAAEMGFFVNGGLGMGSVRMSVDDPSFGTVSTDGTGLGYQLGTGYDLRLAPNFALTPYATYFRTAGIKVAGEKINGNVFHFGVGFSWF